MKAPAPVLHEGPEAFDRFRRAVRTVLTVPKSALPPRYCKKLWMGLAQAASCLMPSTKGTPLMTSTIN